jgi:hypothetical protein
VALIVVASAATTRTPTSTRTAATWTAPAPGSARTAAIGLRTRFVNVQRASAELFPVEGGNGFLGFGGVGHFYKCKSSRTTRVTISDHADLIDLAMRLKQGPKFCFCGAVREIANKKLLHGFPFSVSQRETSDFVGGFG